MPELKTKVYPHPVRLVLACCFVVVAWGAMAIFFTLAFFANVIPDIVADWPSWPGYFTFYLFMLAGLAALVFSIPLRCPECNERILFGPSSLKPRGGEKLFGVDEWAKVVLRVLGKKVLVACIAHKVTAFTDAKSGDCTPFTINKQGKESNRRVRRTEFRGKHTFFISQPERRT